MKILKLLVVLPATSCLLPESALPGMDVDGVGVQEVDWSGATLAIELTVQNPLPLEVRVTSIEYGVTVEGEALAQGERAQDAVIAARGESALTLPLRLEHAAIWSIARALPTQDAIDYVVAGAVRVDTPIGERALPISYQGQLPLVRAPDVSLDNLRVVSLDLSSLSGDLELRLRVSNHLDRVMRLRDLDYALRLGRHPVLSGAREDMGAASPGGAVLSLPVHVELAAVPRFIWDALWDRRHLEVGLRGRVRVETPLGDLPLSIDLRRGLLPG